MIQTKRKTQRHKVNLPVEMETAKGAELCRLVDISMSGCLLKSKQHLNPSAGVTLHFFSKDEKVGEYHPHSPVFAKCVYRTKVDTQGECKYGFEFISTINQYSGITQIIENAVAH